MVVRAVEELLNQAVGGDLGRSSHPGRAAIHLDPAAEQVDRDAGVLLMADRVFRAVNGQAACQRKVVEAELFEEGPEPTFAGEAGGGLIGGRKVDFGSAERPPNPYQPVPRSGDGIPNPLSRN